MFLVGALHMPRRRKGIDLEHPRKMEKPRRKKGQKRTKRTDE